MLSDDESPIGPRGASESAQHNDAIARILENVTLGPDTDEYDPGEEPFAAKFPYWVAAGSAGFFCGVGAIGAAFTTRRLFNSSPKALYSMLGITGLGLLILTATYVGMLCSERRVFSSASGKCWGAGEITLSFLAVLAIIAAPTSMICGLAAAAVHSR